MTHEPDFNALTAFVERRLNESERQRVITHLATCRSCREVVAALTSEPPQIQLASVTAWRRMPGLWSVAAMLVIVVIVGVITARQKGVGPGSPANVEQPASPAVAAPPDSPRVPPDTPTTSPQPAPPEDLGRVRGNERKIDGKTFRFVAGEWIDSSYDSQLLLPVVEATTPADREALLRRVPNLKPFAALRGPVIVVLDGIVYRF